LQKTKNIYSKNPRLLTHTRLSYEIFKLIKKKD